MMPVEPLNLHKLKRSHFREGILKVNVNAENALSENEIQERLNNHYFQSTFYCSFKIPERHKLIHKIVVDNKPLKYSLKYLVRDKKELVYIFYKKCGQLRCVDFVSLPKPELPSGCSINEIEPIIKEFCRQCSVSQ